MIGYGTASLLLSAAAGYWVLERASNQKKQLKTIGQILGTVIIIASLLGVSCKVYCLATGKTSCPPGIVCPVHGKACSMKGGCPFGAQQPSGK